MQQRRQMSKRMQAIILLICVVVGIASGLYIWFDQFYASEVIDLSAAAPPPEATPISPEKQVADVGIPLQPDGSPYPALFIPSAGVSEYILESHLESDGWRVDHLGRRVGHLEGTTPIGKIGNIVLAGHIEDSEGRPSVFSQLGQLEVGAAVTLSHGEDVRQYAVSEVKVVASDDLSVVYDVGDDRLTLITCAGYDFLTDVYDERIVVVALRVQ